MKRALSQEDLEKHMKFRECGNEDLKVLYESAGYTDLFAYGIQTLMGVFGNVDFSKPFRIVVDYDPEQPRTIVKKYLKEAVELDSLLGKENVSDQ